MFNLPDFLRGFAEASSYVLFAYSPARRQVLYANAAAEPMLGIRPEQATGQLPALLARLHPDDRAYLASCLPRWQSGELRERLEFRLQTPGGAERWLCLTPHAQQIDEEACLGGMLEDITVPKAYITNADKFNAKKNSTLEILSHDLAGPFILVQQLAEYISEEVELLGNPTVDKLLREMQTTCAESVNLIRDFVDNEFLESANVQLNLERVDLVYRLGLVMDNYQRGQQNIAKKFTFRTSHPAIYLAIDDNKFQQVINNLISNAIKFTPDGGHIEVAVEQHPRHVLVTVSDDGIGIPAEWLPGLFERFTQARRPGLRGEKSTGLGMSIIKTIVELHGGTIRVKSREEQGTTYYIELPRTETE